MSENIQAASAAKAPAAEFGGRKLNVAIIVAAVVTIAGIALWVVQLSGGMINTGMRNLDSWGLYITMFMFFVGLSAGGLIISSIPRAFGMEGFGGISKVAVWTSICATVCAIAFVVVIALRKVGYLELDQKHLVKLAKMLGAFCIVDLYFFGCDLLTAGFPAASGAEVVEMLVLGQLAPFFWVEVLGTVLAAAICFTPKARTNAMLVGASALAIVAIFCKRVQLLVGGFQLPNLDMAGVVTPHTLTNWEAGFAAAYEGMVYWPTMLEFGVVLGVLGLGVLMLLLGLKKLPLKPAEGSH